MFNKILAFIKKFSKKSKFVNFEDLDYFYSICSETYFERCLIENKKPTVNPVLFETMDKYGRTWEINGPATDDNVNVYMWVISLKDYPFHDDTNFYPPNFIFKDTLALQPNGTCFKIKVDTIVQ